MILLSSSMTALCTNDCLKKNICCRKNITGVILGDPALTYWEFTGKVFANKVYMKNGTMQDSTVILTEASYAQFKHYTPHVRALKLICWERVRSTKARPFLVTLQASPH